MKPKFSKQDVKIEKVTPLYEGFLSIYKYQLKHRLFGGGWSPIIDREIMDRGDAVVVLPYDPRTDELVVLEQFRVGAMNNQQGPWLFEFVAGMFDADESAEEVATRELYEEAGLRTQRLQKALSYYSSPGGTNERLTIYIAEVDASQASDFGGLAEEHEDIRVTKLPFEQAITMLEQGQFNNAASVIGLQWMQLHKQHLFTE
ncbi:ADP-ribose pyrophosphatase [Idiomarina aquatica]|uniref:ADP-ribose pyrophosphatase n=1 Tax=Idiomarina aquatica TaxID=1327752 RepID=A0A4R6P6M0_9GAMM|nr:ADP-ribose pyrophosphatase [Idiomarina aquatica]